MKQKNTDDTTPSRIMHLELLPQENNDDRKITRRFICNLYEYMLPPSSFTSVFHVMDAATVICVRLKALDMFFNL